MFPRSLNYWARGHVENLAHDIEFTQPVNTLVNVVKLSQFVEMFVPQVTNALDPIVDQR